MKNLSMKKSRDALNTNNVGLSRFMSRVYGRMGLGVASSVGMSLILAPVAMQSPSMAIGCFGVGVVASFGSIYGIEKYKPVFHKKTEGTEVIEYAEDVLLREVSFWTLTGGIGVMLAPMMGIITDIDPSIVPASLLMSGGIFGGCALIAAKTKNPNIMQWKAPLFVGLTSLLGIQLVALGSGILFGPNSLSLMLHNVDIYGGIGLFTLMSIYDAHVARQMYLKGEPDHLGCATSVYLDFMNILIRVMEAMAKTKQKQ
jgi:FtsH-binding integral membrane protein